MAVSSPIVYKECPVCARADIQFLLKTKDYFKSHETFEVWQCNTCNLKFTQAIPNERDIIPYYASENYISHSDTQKGWINKLYHWVRNYMLGQKYAWIKAVNIADTPKTILDIGAGTGYFANFMQQKSWEITTVEPDEQAATAMFQKFGIKPYNNEQFYAGKLPEAHFQLISMWHVLEHVHRLDECLVQVSRLLHNGGFFITAMPNHTSYDAEYFKEFWAAWDVPRHLYHFSPESVETLAEKHGFSVTRYFAMPFDAFYVSLLSARYAHKSTFTAFWVGLRSYFRSLREVKKASSVVYVWEKKTI
ncbi:MAG: class I SAM-dependent methyltransferase [Chitinophagales bacterium]|nr:class I SAM-dependent methyltransferase [Bacteroidota bacterium]MCB9042877.1 class I SAM-dependent methyltransferase [Chitinophagales bacterium]